MSNWKIPTGLKYTSSDEWVLVEGEEAVIGITDYAQQQLSDLVFVELPKLGSTYSAGQTFGVIESVKAAADINMPLKGQVLAVNSALESAPETINQDPYDLGWIVRIKVSDPTELGNLMDNTAYTAYCNERS